MLSPLSGTKNVSNFTFVITPSAIDPLINWGDGSFSYSNSASHVYSSIGLYSVYGGGCSSTSAYQVSVYDGNFYSDKIEISRSAISSLVSCPFTFNINISSQNPVNTVILYAGNSYSAPYSTQRNFWSHLNPEWEFLYNEKQISQIEITGSPVYSGSYVLGYSASSAVQYKDDMPGNPALTFTIQKKSGDVPINSRAYASINHSICAVVPDKLFITADGINPLNKIQWADKQIPYVISIGSSQISCSNILHYVSGSITGIDFRSGCYGISPSEFVYSVAQIDSFDSSCFPTGGYTLSTFSYPSSALPDLTITNNLEECYSDYSDIEFIKTRKTPKNVTLSATGSFLYNGVSYSLTGVSNPFDLLLFENRHSFYRKGEDYTVYDILKSSMPFELEQYTNLNRYLSSIAGEGDSLGKSYDKIQNFSKDHSDLDVCTYEALINKAKQFDCEFNNFGLSFPEELKRIFNFTTIPLQKLIGTRCVCNTNFVNCQGCQNSNICTICKFDKRSNLGDIINHTDYITAGDTILYKETAASNFNFLNVPSEIGSVYQLQLLSSLEPFNSKPMSDFCFYKWDSRNQNNPVESVINYKDSRNMLNPSLSSNSDWYSDNGIVEEMFNYILTKNLLN